MRNKQVTKHFTEKTVKEVWREKLAADKRGEKAFDLVDFVCNYFQKRMGIMSAVVEVWAHMHLTCASPHAAAGRGFCMSGLMTHALPVQMGYNLLYGLWKYSWDADCELFLKILQGEMKEDVYLQQIQLQARLTYPVAALIHAACPAGHL